MWTSPSWSIYCVQSFRISKQVCKGYAEELGMEIAKGKGKGEWVWVTWVSRTMVDACLISNWCALTCCRLSCGPNASELWVQCLQTSGWTPGSWLDQLQCSPGISLARALPYPSPLTLVRGELARSSSCSNSMLTLTNPWPPPLQMFQCTKVVDEWVLMRNCFSQTLVIQTDQCMLH